MVPRFSHGDWRSPRRAHRFVVVLLLLVVGTGRPGGIRGRVQGSRCGAAEGHPRGGLVARSRGGLRPGQSHPDLGTAGPRMRHHHPQRQHRRPRHGEEARQRPPHGQYVVAELSIRLNHLGVPRLVTQHLAGRLSKEADWLSRPHDRPRDPPAGLTGVKLKRVAALKLGDWALPLLGLGGPNAQGIGRLPEAVLALKTAGRCAMDRPWKHQAQTHVAHRAPRRSAAGGTERHHQPEPPMGLYAAGLLLWMAQRSLLTCMVAAAI